jgi:hypothetical protein
VAVDFVDLGYFTTACSKNRSAKNPYWDQAFKIYVYNITK